MARAGSRLLGAAVLLGIGVLPGCMAPGSGMTRFEVSGRYLDGSGAPVAGEPVRLVLPGKYGLRGLDAMFGKPEDYGHRNQVVDLLTDGDGRFGHTFTTTYTACFWLIPPIGMAFSSAPDPAIVAFLPRHPGQYYSIVGDEEEVSVRAFDNGTGEELDSDAVVPVLIEGRAVEVEGQGPKGWVVEVTIQEKEHGE